MTRVLLAGDHFVRNDLIREALATAVADIPGSGRLEPRELLLPWPVEPFGQVAEVSEAAGTEEQLIEALDGVEICLTQMAPITDRVLAASPTLRLVCVARGGPVNVNLAAARARGVTVCAAPGRNATATAEHTMALILAALRGIPQRDAELHAGQWRGDHYRYDAVPPELAGSTVGLVGYGAVARRVAVMLAAFGAHLLVYDPYIDDADLPPGAERVRELDELLARSLVVSLHARATRQTTGMIGRSQLELMPDGSILVNAARGALLDYDALADVLARGKLRCAALDVFPQEPLPNGSPLRNLQNVIMTPHVAGASTRTATNAAQLMAEEVRRYLLAEPPNHPV